MSMEECTWAMRQEGISSRARFVLVVLGNASTDFEADYSLAYLSKNTLLSEKDCQRALNSLVRANCIWAIQTGWDPVSKNFRRIAYLNKDRQS